MLERLISLASYGFYEGSIGEILVRAEEAGVFTYLLPFLLIFALVNGILGRIGIFSENKAVNPIIAFVVGLMALQFGFVSSFFSEVFPRLGVGLSIILIVLVVIGLFMDPKDSGLTYTLLGVSVVIVGIVLIQSGVAEGTRVGFWFEEYWEPIAWVVAFLIVFLIVAGVSNPNKRPRDNYPIGFFGIPDRK